MGTVPRTLSFPPPSTATCPICSTPLSDPRCGTCGASFAGEDGATLWRVDHDLFDLCRIRNDVVHRLLTTAAAPGPAAPPAPAPWSPPTTHPVAARPAVGPVGPPAAPPVDRDPSATARPDRDRSETGPVSSTTGTSGPDGPSVDRDPSAVPGPGPEARPVPSAPAVPASAGPSVDRDPSAGAASVSAGPDGGPAGPSVDRDPSAGPASTPDRPGPSEPGRPSRTDRDRSESGPVPWGRPSSAPLAARSGPGGDPGPFGADWSAASSVPPPGRTRPVAGGRWAPSSAPDPDGGPGQASAPPPAGPDEPPPGRAPRPRPSLTAAEVLVGLGALSLVAAVAVFAAVSWSDLAAWAQGALVVGLTGAVLGTAVACRRRDLVATSESLGAVGVALGLADVQVARVGLDGVVAGRTAWAVGIAMVAVGTIALGRASGIRVLGLAGRALAFAPLVVATSGGSPLAALGALAVQAVVGGAVVRRQADPRSDRVVAGVGAALSWCGAVAGSLSLAAAGLAADPVAHPVGPAVVLAALAAVSIAAARRSGEGASAGADLVGGAGAALALVPAVLLALGSGSVLVLLAVFGVQGVLALGWAGDERASGGERLAAAVGGAVCGSTAATGLLALAVVRLVDGDPVTGPTLVLAALALGSIATGRVRPSVVALGAAGTAISFAPGLLLAAGTGSVVTVLAVAAGQALVARAVSDRLTAAEAPAAAGGGALCWVGAAAGSLAVGLERIGAGGSPVGPALVLAGLAAGSVLLARRSEDDLLAGAGTAIALVPGLLLAAGTGSVVTVLAVAAAQAVLALAVAGRLTSAERPVAVAGGWALGLGAAVGSLLLAVVEIASAPDDPDLRAGALLVLAGLAVASVVVGRSTARSPLVAAGAGLAFLPVPLAVVGVVTPSVLVAVGLGEALAAALLATVVGRGEVRAVLVTGGATAWGSAVVGAGTLGLAGWLATPVRGPAGSIALLVALAGVAVGASLLGRWDTTATGVGLGAAVGPALLAVALAAGGLGVEGWVAAVLGAAAVLALGLGLLDRVDDRRPWGAPSGVALVVGAALAVVPVRTVSGVVAALFDRAAWDPDVGGRVGVADWLRPALDAAGFAVPGWAAVAQVTGAAVLVGAVALLHRRTGRVLGVLVATGAVVVAPVAMGLTIAVTVGGLALLVVALGVVVSRRPRDPELLAGAGAVVLVGTAFAVGAAPWTVGWTVVVGLAVGLLAVEVVARRSSDAPAWVGTAAGVVLAGVGLDAWVLGASGVDGLLAVAVAAVAMSPGAVLLERRGLDVAADVVDVLVSTVLALAPFVAVTATGDVFSLSPFLVLVGVTAAGAALRPRRRAAWLVATGSAVLLAWVEVGRAEIVVAEAYTLPLAAWALLVGAGAGRGFGRGSGTARPLGSWELYGIGLLTAAGPTTVLALLDPDPVRTVGVVALGAAVAIWGAAARLQAPLAVGTAAVAVLAVRHLGPVSVDLPRYVTFAVAGLVLLAVGATFEQRRQDLRHARDAFVRLR